MELAKALDVRQGVTAIIGAGGKTTLLARGMPARYPSPDKAKRPLHERSRRQDA